ncbi:glycosyltransferase family 4 protein [Pseudoroseicyclus tamaricis]|uniref:Glycosyltransferase family 4 protein n=1 Tax=Pseudoroseicyclus tamaricis TaxID=2705421 RepID=A0A6B2JZC6_9RHOB|nr:glycosyltransferase family 4 protein [Pseudoroseicyclus tamaricis]NDU99475.1 glycosyltransferase family 4 protein [Pseudoroseicyclus tamaricis]
MTIAYLTGEYPRATDTFIQREVAALRALGLDVATCTIRRTGPEHLTGPEQREEAGRTFAVLPALKRPREVLFALGDALRRPGRLARAAVLAWRTSPGGLRALAYQAIYLAEAITLARHLAAIGATHLHNHIAQSAGTVAMLAAELTGLPFSFTLHGPDDFFATDRWALPEKIARARFVACISHFARSQAMLLSPEADWPKLHIVHCGIDPARYRAGAREGTQLLFVGRLAAAKGLPVLLEAFAEALRQRPDLRLTLIGDGPDRAALERRAAGLPVTFAGYQSQEAVAEALSTTDLFVLPSFAEGLPVVLMEALAAEVPVVATRIAGVAELVEDGVSGRLVPPGDPAALAEAILAVLAGDGAAMGRAGRAAVTAGFTSAGEAETLAALLRGSP